MKTLYLLPLSIILLTSCESKQEKLQKKHDMVWQEEQILWKELRKEDSLYNRYEDSLKQNNIKPDLYDPEWNTHMSVTHAILNVIGEKQREQKRLYEKIRNLELGLEE